MKKKVLLCVTGSVAAYKALELTRLLVKLDFEVKVILTKAAKSFVTPLSFETLSQHKVYDNLFNYIDHPIEHIKLARWADHIIIAPASANVIAKLAIGIADDLLGNIILASQKMAFIAPAMNMIMWKNNALQNNIKILQNRGFKILLPSCGYQACGDIGEGRLMEPESIIKHFIMPRLKVNKCVLITAGPTIESLDPVRYLSNHSSGKMGYALAEAFLERGWKVILISGPTHLKLLNGVKTFFIKSAQEMYNMVHENVAAADLFIAAAAVADYRPKNYISKKLKKDINNELTLKLIKNKDILHSVSTLSTNRPCCIGFAAEIHNAEKNALLKVDEKNLDYIILNKVDSCSGFPFYSEKNKIQLFNKKHDLVLESTLTSKNEIAFTLAEYLSRPYIMLRDD